MTCPQCGLQMAFDKRVFQPGFICSRCLSPLFVSEGYGRLLLIVSIVIGYGLPWALHLPRFLIAAFGPLEGFAAALALGVLLACVVLFWVLRIVPRLISPPLVPRLHGAVTVLDLAAGRGRQCSQDHRK